MMSLFYKIADLTTQIPTADGLDIRCKDYQCDEVESADIIIRTELYRREKFDPTLSAEIVAEVESGYQFYLQLINYDGFYLHSSAVVKDGRAYLFSGPCGVGKSTHTRLWQECFGEEAYVINDDKPALRRIDGKWYVYGFKSDGLPVGSSRCGEAKIYLNPNTWAIFTGIEEDEKRIEKIRQSIFTYLTTPYGSLLNYPPYVNDLTCGRIGTQVPGTFANSAVYLHAASFEVFAKTKLKKTEEAYDLFMRLIPNHIDNPDSRRTSEPFCTGNVHYGPNNERFGMNLFSWFTATPAWLIHGGFDEILGVKAEFDGLRVCPCVPDDWDGYSVKRTYRDKEYFLNFKKSDDKKGVFANGEKISENFIPETANAETFEIYY